MTPEDRPPPDLPPLREVIRRHGLSADKALGQNFLLDGNLLARIVRASGDLTGRRVLEIGPGPGGLTRALLASPAAEVVAVERDRRFLPALDELATAFAPRLRVVVADALTLDEAALGGRLTVVANLPYNVATVLWLRWLERIELFDGFTLLFQKEVAERIAASPGTGAYGRLAVRTRRLCAVRRLFDIPARAFVPPPKVTSALIGLVPLPRPAFEVEPRAFDRVLAAAFGQRRKMLRVSLRGVTPEPEALLAAAGIEPTLRPEVLAPEDFGRLARAFAATRGEGADVVPCSGPNGTTDGPP